jgi:hypothetical protein
MFLLTVHHGIVNNTHQLDTLHIHFRFIKTQSLVIFRASLAHPQEALHEHSFGGCKKVKCSRYSVWLK